MPDRTEPWNDRPSGLERSLVRLGRATLGVLYVLVALLGALHLDPWTTLLAVPFFALLAMGLRWSVHSALVTGTGPSLGLLLPAATVGALFAPFGTGIQLLGEHGAYLALVLVVLLTALGSHWLHRLEIPAAPAATGDRPPAAPPRAMEPSQEDRRELLKTLALDDLIDEWRRSHELPHPMSLPDRHAAARWRGALLDELQSRDPRGFADWLLEGMARGPEHHIRAGSDGTATPPDDSPR